MLCYNLLRSWINNKLHSGKPEFQKCYVLQSPATGHMWAKLEWWTLGSFFSNKVTLPVWTKVDRYASVGNFNGWIIYQVENWLIDWARFNVPTKHITGHIGDGFYGSNNPTNSVKALKEDRILRIRLQSHQVHPTVLTIIQQLCSMKQKHTKYT